MCLAVPGQVVEIQPEPDPALRRAKVDFAGVRKDVSLAFTPDVLVGEYVLVHVGFALAVIDEAEARRVFETLREMGELEEELR
jgi:hydrogenase expression/formation protein HypC